MNRIVLHIILLFPLCLLAQKEEDLWQQEKDYLEYRKTKGYSGPDNWYNDGPSSMKEENYNSSSSTGQGLQYVPQQIQRDREDRLQGFDRGGGGGTLPYDPEIERPDKVEQPEFEPPDIDAPDVDIPNPKVSSGFWNFLLILLIAIILFVIAYLIIRNRKAPNTRLAVEVDNEWNPEVISKTELELRLEAAMEREDYRECVRIYFTFILKELIRKNWIQWKKDKTNYDYVLEMRRREGAHHFNECVRVYDLVWYGEYFIDREIYELLQPGLEAYYKSLDPKDE